MSKRILVVCQHFWPETFRINDICNFFIENGCAVDVLCGIPNYPKGKFFEGYSFFHRRKETHNQININRVIEIPRGNNSNFQILINYLSFPFFSLFHIPSLLMKKYDKIFIYQLSPIMMAIAGIIIGKLSKTETIMYVLDLWPENLFSVLKIKNSFLRKLVTLWSHWHYKNVDKLIVLSSLMKNQLISITKIQESKIIILPQACEKIYEQNIYDELLSHRFKNSFNILFTGNISPAQSFETMIGAANILNEKGMNDIRWIIVGDGMSRKQFENEVREQKLEHLFIFEGQKKVEDIPKYVGVADLLVGCLVKSKFLEATIPAKVMSYIASGKPMVLAMDGEIQILINDTIKCGFVGPVEDATSLAENIKKMYFLSSEQRNSMGANGKKYHFENFERNLVLTKLYKFILSDSVENTANLSGIQ